MPESTMAPNHVSPDGHADLAINERALARTNYAPPTPTPTPAHLPPDTVLAFLDSL